MESTGAALGAVVVVVVVVAVLIGHARLLQHRETLKMLELGGDGEKALRLRERWRNRAGLLHGVKLLVVGGALLLAAVIAPRLRLWPPDIGGFPVSVWGLVGLILVMLGATYLVAYAIWSGRPLFTEAGTSDDTESNANRDT